MINSDCEFEALETTNESILIAILKDLMASDLLYLSGADSLGNLNPILLLSNWLNRSI
jgi:hypothetical protein